MTKNKTLAIFIAFILAGAIFADVQVFSLRSGASRQAQQAKALATEVKTRLSQQTSNRAVNVTSWCTSINLLQSALTHYVAAVGRRHPGVLALNLTPLDCQKIVQATLLSTRAR